MIYIAAGLFAKACNMALDFLYHKPAEFFGFLFKDALPSFKFITFLKFGKNFSAL